MHDKEPQALWPVGASFVFLMCNELLISLLRQVHPLIRGVSGLQSILDHRDDGDRFCRVDGRLARFEEIHQILDEQGEEIRIRGDLLEAPSPFFIPKVKGQLSPR